MNKEAYNYSIRLLSRRDYSIFKMQKKLKEREYTQEETNEVIDKLLEQNYLREEEYARMKTKTYLLKGYTNRYIIKKLEQENLAISDDFIQSLRKEQDLHKEDLLQQLIHKKLRSKTIPSEFTELQKLRNKLLYFLGSKGYSFEESNNALSEYLKHEQN